MMSIFVGFIIFIGLTKSDWILGDTSLPFDGDANMGIGLDPTDNKTIWFIGCRGIYSFDIDTHNFTYNDTLSNEFNNLYINELPRIIRENLTADAVNEDSSIVSGTATGIDTAETLDNHMEMCISWPINIKAMTSTVYDNKIYLIVSNGRVLFSFDLITKEIDMLFNWMIDPFYSWRATMCNYKDNLLMLMGGWLQVPGVGNFDRVTSIFNLTKTVPVIDFFFFGNQQVIRYEGTSCYYDEMDDIMWLMGGDSSDAQRTVSRFINETWSSENNILSKRRYSMDLVVKDRLMYIIGGGIQDSSSENPSGPVYETQIIDLDGDIQDSYIPSDMNLTTFRSFVSTILVDNTIYAFGGLITYGVGIRNTYQNSWEYFKFPTMSPSMSPTIEPTLQPSMSPINATDEPTTEPTTEPTMGDGDDDDDDDDDKNNSLALGLGLGLGLGIPILIIIILLIVWFVVLNEEEKTKYKNQCCCCMDDDSTDKNTETVGLTQTNNPTDGGATETR